MSFGCTTRRELLAVVSPARAGSRHAAPESAGSSECHRCLRAAAFGTPVAGEAASAKSTELTCAGDDFFATYYTYADFTNDQVLDATTSESVSEVLNSPVVDGRSSDFETYTLSRTGTHSTVAFESEKSIGSIELERVAEGWRPEVVTECAGEGSLRATGTAKTSTTMIPTPWQNNVQEGFYIDNNVPQNMKGAIRWGLIEFSDLAGGAGPNFVPAGDITASNDFEEPSCSQVNIVFANEDVDTEFDVDDPGTLGLTQVCADGGQIKAFEITYEKTPTGAAYGSSTGWFTGSTSPGGSQVDLRSVAIHEAGHAAGFTRPETAGHLTSAADCPSQFNQRATMCLGLNLGSIWARSLEAPDLREMNAAY